MQYKSPITLLGIPLVHVAVGAPRDSAAMRGIAKGWIAVGDIAFGIVLAVGGVAIGGLSIGGVSLGVLALAGLSIGLWSIGGLAIGVLAFGGAAIGLSAAMGGLAVAGDYAVGGMAIGPHANDEAARAYFGSGFFAFAEAGSRYVDWLIAFLVGLGAIVWLLRRQRDDQT